MDDARSPEQLTARVAELERQLAAAQAEARRYRTLIADFPHGITVSDADGRIVESNRAAERLLGLGREEHEGRTLDGAEWRIVGSDREDLPSERWASVVALRQGRPVHGQVMGLQRPDGSTVWLRVSAVPVQHDDGGAIVTYSDITEQKLAEERLKKLAHDQSAILDHVPALIYFKDTENNIISISKRVAEVTGIPAEEIVGRHSAEIYPEMADRYWADDLEVIRSGVPKTGIVEPLPTSDGSRWLLTDKIPYLDDEGAVSGIIVMAKDITDRVQAESRLAESETKFRSLFEFAADAVYLATIEGRFVDVNRAARRQTGYSRDELLRMSVADLDPRAIEEDDRGRIWERLELRQTITIQTHHRRKDGSTFPAEISLSAMEIDGRPLILAFVRDVTEKNRILEELRRSEERLSLAFQGANDGLWDWNLQTDDVFYSPRWKSMLGYEDHEIENRFSEWERLVAPEDRETAWEVMSAYLAGERPTFECEFRMRHKDGRWVDILSRAFAVRDERGDEPVRVVGTHVDITERKEMQARLEQAQRLESIGNLAGGIAHDFNNILSPIMGLAELLLQDLPPDGPAHEDAREILSASERGRDLVQRILAFSRRSDGAKEPIRLARVLDEVVKMARATIPTNIEIGAAIADDCGVVVADATHIHQVVMNLVTNAYHAVEPRGGRISVELAETDVSESDAGTMRIGAGRYARIQVADTGCGIAPAHQTKIFEPYFTTKGQGKGTGIGLSTAYGIVRNHGGAIRVRSELDRGSTFDVYLPLMTRGRAAAEASSADPVPRGSERVLIVDDDEAIARLEKRMLEGLGYEVTALASARETLARFAADPSRYDLVLTDMTMPDMTGDQLARELIAIRPDLPIIACTGYSNRLDGSSASELGMRGVLAKPLTRAGLARKVRDVLDGA